GVEPLGVGARDLQPDAAQRLLRRQTAGQLLPGRAAVGRLEHAAGRTAEVAVLPRPLPRRPQRGVDGVGTGRIDDDVDAAGVLVLVQHLLERLAAVGGAEDAALRVRAVRVTEDGDEEAVRIARVDGDGGDLLA